MFFLNSPEHKSISLSLFHRWEMTELDEIKIKIADTERKLKEEEAQMSENFTRRDRLEGILLEQQKEKNFLLAGSGN